MGPITLFDKSFLQSLSLDESVWFDHFFPTNLCPLFYVETLADLNKTIRSGRTPEDEVRIIASKFPEMHATPNVQHVTACIQELRGYRVPMTGQMLVAGGRPVKANAQSGIVFQESPESKAFSRWQNSEFKDIEHNHAREWRAMVTNLDLNEMANRFKKLGINGKTCKTLEQAKALADEIVSTNDKPFEQMHLALLFLNIDQCYYTEILHRWSTTNYRPLKQYAPYVAYVYTIELFFQIALAANLISSSRPSNRIDIGYLFYLPFSNAFVSTDKLHRKCAPLFLRKNQQFLWGGELKKGLNEINDYFSKYPDSVKEKGIMAFAGTPPKEGDYIVSKIWDEYNPGWRHKKEVDLSDKKIKHDKLLKHINKFQDAKTLSPDEVDFDMSNPESVTLTRMLKKKKGSWFQLPIDIEANK